MPYYTILVLLLFVQDEFPHKRTCANGRRGRRRVVRSEAGTEQSPFNSGASCYSCKYNMYLVLHIKLFHIYAVRCLC